MSNEVALTQQQVELEIESWLNEIPITNPRAQSLVEIARDSTVPTLDVSLQMLEASMRRQAVLDILPMVAESDYTGQQIRSILHGAMLMRTKVLDWASFNIVYSNLKTIRDEGLAQIHPNQYIRISRDGEDLSFLEMAEQEGGIPASVASDVMTLGDIILPYFEEELGIPGYEVWDRVNRTNLRSMIPLLRYLINSVRDTGDTRRTQRRVIDRAHMAAVRWYASENNIEVEPDNSRLDEMSPGARERYLSFIEENRRVVERELSQMRPSDLVSGTARWLLRNAENNTVENFSRLTAAQDEPTVDAYIYPNEHGTYTLLGVLTQEQRDLIQRVMRDRIRLSEASSMQDLIRIMERNANATS